jgi:hypothetical protein
MRACCICRKMFAVARPMQKVCGIACAKRVPVRERRAKVAEEKAAAKAKAEAFKPLSYWASQAQAAFNAWIRWRDRAQPCISCGCMEAVQWHAGHYRSIGAARELRFHPDNVHRQCSQCNDWKGGNAVEYRIGLAERIGAERLEQLEGPHDHLRYKAADYQRVRDEYKARLKLEQGAA